MKKYKQSKYNCLQKSLDNSIILYNPLYKSIAKVNQSDDERITGLLSNEQVVCTDGSDEFINRLVNKGYLVPEKFDESLMVRRVISDTINRPLLELCMITTQQCNFRCSYCFENVADAPKGTMSAEVQDAIVDYVKKHITQYSGLEVSWFGGEPLMAMPVIRRLSKLLIEVCAAYKKPYYATVTTNGYLLTRDVFEELLEYKVREYQITLDGGKELHDQQRFLANGEGSFDTILKNLVDIKQHCKGRFFVNIRTNFSQQMYEYLAGFLQLMDECFYPDSRFKLYFALVQDMGGSFLKEMKEQLVSNSEIFLTKKVLELLPHKELYSPDWVMSRLMGGQMCGLAKKNCVVFENTGDVHKCSTYFQTLPDTRVGGLEDGKMVIDPYRETMWLMQGDETDTLCKECFMKPVCINTGCPVQFVGANRSKAPICRWKEPEKEPWRELLLFADELGMIQHLEGAASWK